MKPAWCQNMKSSHEFVTHHSVSSNTIGDKALRFITINSTDENKNPRNKWQSRISVHMLNLRADQLCICCTHPALMKWCAAAIMPVWGLSAWVSQRAETDRDTDGMNFREMNKWERKRMQAETGHLYVTEKHSDHRQDFTWYNVLLVVIRVGNCTDWKRGFGIPWLRFLVILAKVVDFLILLQVSVRREERERENRISKHLSYFLFKVQGMFVCF